MFYGNHDNWNDCIEWVWMFFSVKDIMFVQVYMFHFNTASEKNISFMSETRKNDWCSMEFCIIICYLFNEMHCYSCFYLSSNLLSKTTEESWWIIWDWTEN